VSDTVQIEKSWKAALDGEFSKPYFSKLKELLVAERAKGKTVYPPGSQIFNAFNYTPFDEVKVVILGQDPYHGAGQAHGLSFSVPQGIKPPPSLVNIFKELKTDIGMEIPGHGNLEHWAKQGVLLLNASLTVNAGEPNSHAAFGWHQFTDAVIDAVSQSRPHVVFMLWGRFAQEKGARVDTSKHLVLKSAHPSPFSVTNFLGNKHFSKANEWLVQKGMELIDWKL
jgi:uracil-DNA glycosylase